MKKFVLPFLKEWLVSCLLVLSAAAADEYDIVVYGGTPGGVMAVVAS